MMAAMREFDWSYEFGMYAGIAVGIFAVALVATGLFLAAVHLLNGVRRRRSERL